MYSESKTGLPYKPAKVMIPPDGSKDSRIYIECYVYDALKEKAIRKRYYKYTDVTDREKQIKLLTKACVDLNKFLADGNHLNPKNGVDVLDTFAYKTNTNLIAGLRLALDSKSSLRKKTYTNYKLYGNDFIKWIKSKGLEKMQPAGLNKLLCDQFKKFLSDNGYSNRTINNYLSHNQTLFEYLISLDIVKENPFKKVDRLPVGMGRNVAFNKLQQKELTKYMAENYPEMLVFCQYMYYTMARPNEICNTLVKWIGLKAPDKIFLPEEISKSVLERNITITPALQKILDTLHLDVANPNHYIFSTGLRPGKTPMSPNKVADKFTQRVLKKFKNKDGARKYGPEYTLYSWKHTSVVNNYRAGMSRAALKQQLGYKYDYSLEAYLKSLALIDERDLKDKFVEL